MFIFLIKLFLKKSTTRCLSMSYIGFFLFFGQINAQRFYDLKTPDSLNKKRFWAATSVGIVGYSSAVVGLNKAWYANYPRTDFHFFNDNRQWNQMDKFGHFFTAYTDARWTAAAARWTGISPKKSAWIGFALGETLQATFEVLDGFSSEYGFSWGDIGCNTAGATLFLGQQLAWHEQRIVLKMSAFPVKYPAAPIYSVDNQHVTTLQQRADDLYGTGFVNLFLKNYNTLVLWSSVNVRSFSPNRENSKIPKWLNVAGGYGANNLFRGESKYGWIDTKTGAEYQIDPNKYPRERQFFLSLDVDLTKLPIKNRFLKTVAGMLNCVKFPAPTLEMTSRGKVRLHPIYF
jgi:uncharacterized protein YfiM (DUF2279 family)